MQKLLVSLVLFVAVALPGFSAERKMLSDLPAAIETATKENKLIFITYGREACGNCKNLKTLINERKVKLFDSEFLLVDLDCDTPAVSRAFNSKYRALMADAKTLPFVVIAKPDGTPVAGIASFHNEKDYNKFIMDAKKKAKAAN